MTPRQKRQAALAVVCALGSLSASVSGLVEVAARVHAPGLELPGGYTFPIATIGLVLSLDGLHLASAYAAHARNRSKPTIVLLLATTALSAGLQAWAAKAPANEPDLIALARVVALLPACMTLGALWLAIKSMDIDEAEQSSAKPAGRPKKPAQAAPAPARPSPLVSEPAGDLGDARPALKSVPSEEQMVADVDDWLTKHHRRPTKTAVQEAARELDLPCKGSDPALAIAAQIRDRRERAS